MIRGFGREKKRSANCSTLRFVATNPKGDETDYP